MVLDSVAAAVLSAGLIVLVSLRPFQAKLLRSKDNTLTREIIKRNLVKEFLTSCSFKEKKTTSQCIMRKLEPTLSMVDIGWFSEQEDELDGEPE